MTAAFDDQAQIVFSAKIDCGDNVFGLLGCYRVDTWD
jgi:hypothetical protein